MGVVAARKLWVRRSYLGYMTEFMDDLAVALDDILLELKSYLAAYLGGIREPALIYHGQDLSELRVGV